MIIVGERKDSQTYVRMKIKACQEVGIASFEAALPASASQEDIVAKVKALNADPQVHGQRRTPSAASGLLGREMPAVLLLPPPPSLLSAPFTHLPLLLLPPSCTLQRTGAGPGATLAGIPLQPALLLPWSLCSLFTAFLLGARAAWAQASWCSCPCRRTSQRRRC